MSKIKIPGIRSAIADAIKVRTLDFIEKRSSLKNPPYWLLNVRMIGVDDLMSRLTMPADY